MVGGNVDEVEISTVSITQCPAHSDIHSSTDIFREVNTGEGGDTGGTWSYVILHELQAPHIIKPDKKMPINYGEVTFTQSLCTAIHSLVKTPRGLPTHFN